MIMKKLILHAFTFVALVAVGILLAAAISKPTRDLKFDLGRWIKPDALTDEGKAALLRP